MNYPLDILMLPIQLIVAWFTVYYTVIAVFGIWHRKDRGFVCAEKQIRAYDSGAQ